MMGVKQLTQALAGLSDAEWTQVRGDEDRRRADVRTIRSLSERYRELRERKGARRHRGGTA